MIRKAPARGDSVVHLHVQSAYSLGTGASLPEELAGAAREGGITALALTDFGTLAGLPALVRALAGSPVRVIFGLRVRVAPEDGGGGLLLYARNVEGYRELVALATASATGPVRLSASFANLLVLEPWDGAVLRRLLLDEGEGRRLLATRRERFAAGSYGLEWLLPLRGVGDPGRLARLVREERIPRVATFDVLAARPEDLLRLRALAAVRQGKRLEEIGDPPRPFHLLSRREMEDLHREDPGPLEEAERWADACRVEWPPLAASLPRFPLPLGRTAQGELEHRCQLALAAYGGDRPQAVRRLALELRVIRQAGLADYFLIVADIVGWARGRGIRVGPGRGSGAGSLVAYLLGITAVDPLEYGLLFERFLNPERQGMPDLDIDFEDERREEVLAYVRERFSPEAVAQVATYGTFGLRAALRDGGRLLEMTGPSLDRLVAAAEESGLEALGSRASRLREVAEALLGRPRHISTHAAAVLISPVPLADWVPLLPGSGPSSPSVAALVAEDLADLGLLKMDLLGLRALSVLRRAQELAGRGSGDPPADDRETWRLIGAARTAGLFQLESVGMQRLLKQLRPSRMAELMAALALFRPGPMEELDRYLQNRRSGRWPSLHPLVDPLLTETCGVIVYQEQVMEVARAAAGFSLGEADLLRRAMAKKREDLLTGEEFRFLAGAEQRGMSREAAVALWRLLVKFAGYGFNKSHAAAYAPLTYHLAYLKAHHPAAFWAALLTGVAGDGERLRRYQEAARQEGTVLLPATLQESQVTCTVEGSGIRLGLGTLRHVGEGLAARLVQERDRGGPFADGTDLRRRVPELTRLALSALAEGGALPAWEGQAGPSQPRLFEEPEAQSPPPIRLLRLRWERGLPGERVAGLLRQHPGDVAVELVSADGRVQPLGAAFRVTVSESLLAALAECLGPDRIEMIR